ncbi:VWA domain-containing protein [Streptomyces sp. NPDC007164]|uniref:vWA domain-containing protein n=1 Tax=Streptomyces sp. NPDC007164 TaxID=3156918 RepID=UPI0033E151FC
MPTAPVIDATAVAVGLSRALRAAGVATGPDRTQLFLGALDLLDPARRADVYWAGRLTLCGSRDDLERYDRVFAGCFDHVLGPYPATRATPLSQPRPRWVDTGAGPLRGSDRTSEDPTPPRAAPASETEILRHRDMARLTAAERAQLRRLLAAFALSGEPRRTARMRPARRGGTDPRRTVRELLRHGGEPARLRHRAPVTKPRRTVLLLDVSGSMDPYADALLRFAHAAAHGPAARTPTEVFTIGTRLTRVTREMAHPDPDTALAAVAAAVPDRSGGTRLGEMLRAFLDRWGQRSCARGAVVVVLSDGWERADPALLAAQMVRLHRLAHRVVWANPRKARPGYAPLAAGMAAALPHVDVFVEGHSLAALEQLAAVVRGVASDA